MGSEEHTASEYEAQDRRAWGEQTCPSHVCALGHGAGESGRGSADVGDGEASSSQQVDVVELVGDAFDATFWDSTNVRYPPKGTRNSRLHGNAANTPQNPQSTLLLLGIQGLVPLEG